MGKSDLTLSDSISHGTHASFMYDPIFANVDW